MQNSDTLEIIFSGDNSNSRIFIPLPSRSADSFRSIIPDFSPNEKTKPEWVWNPLPAGFIRRRTRPYPVTAAASRNRPRYIGPEPLHPRISAGLFHRHTTHPDSSAGSLPRTSYIGIPVKSVNFIFTILTAFTVSIAARTVGALIVSSMMVVPVACAMKFAKSYKQTVLFSILLALIFTIIGLTLSYYLGLKPGGTIVLSGVAFLILTIIIKRD